MNIPQTLVAKIYNLFAYTNLHIGNDQLVHSSVDWKENICHYEEFSTLKTFKNEI
jgi:hypothetical protein